MAECHVNKIFGGGVFVCRKPATTKNGFCEFHGNQTAATLDLELTWREWFKVQFIRRPQNAARVLRSLPRKIRYWWYTRNFPKCELCTDKAMSKDGGRCIDHTYW